MLQAQQRLGDFEIIRLLGKGGMGEVYEALQSNPQRRVALKVLSPWLAENDDALERFWREASVPAQLDHPNIVRIISTGKTENIAYYAMQLVRGISLAELVRTADATQPSTDAKRKDQTTRLYQPPVGDSSPQSGPPPILGEYQRDRFRTTARIGVQAARALGSAHRQGFLHRDIKPSNLMIDHHNQLYLVDFGLTRALTAASDITRHGILVGTPWFMSPEQARGEPLDERSDVFSLGVTLYQLASGGCGPYTASHQDSDAVLRQVRQGSRMPLESVSPEVPPALGRIIMRAIDPSPELRHQSMDELAADLEEWLDPNSAPTRTFQMRSPWRQQTRRRLYQFTAIGVLLAVIAWGIYWSATRGPSGNPSLTSGAAADGAKPTAASRWRHVPIVGARQPLFREDHQPIEFHLVKGTGVHTALSTGLVVSSTEPLMPTMIALAGMSRQGFEFRVDVRPGDYNRPRTNDLGLFFGYRDRSGDPLARPRFFVVQLDRRPVLKDEYGRLKIGTALLEEGGEGRGSVFDFFRPLPQDFGWIPLEPPSEERPWYTLWVRVEDGKISVGVDKLPPKQFDVPWLMRTDRWLQPYTVEPRGELGIWVRGGQGLFRNATLMALAEEHAENP